MTDNVLFLSEQWLREADAALALMEPLPDVVTIAYRVSGGPGARPGRSADHQLVLGPDHVGIRPGVGDASVVMSLDWDLAVAINQGRTGAKRAVLDGRITISGDSGALLGHQRHLADIDDRLAGLRARTVYDADPPGPSADG